LLTSFPGHFTAGKNLSAHCIGRWVGSRDGVDGLDKEKIFYLCWNSKAEPSNLKRSDYTKYAIPAVFKILFSGFGSHIPKFGRILLHS
jgi:hypothetical protein